MTTLLISFDILEGLCASEIFYLFIYFVDSDIACRRTLPFSIVIIKIRQTCLYDGQRDLHVCMYLFTASK